MVSGAIPVIPTISAIQRNGGVSTLIALSAGGWWSIFSPILMTLLLLRVSGVALLEKTLETRPGYKEYSERTSSFIPWLPRK